MTGLILHPTTDYRLCRKKYPDEGYKVQIDSLVLQRAYIESPTGRVVWQDVKEHIEMVETGLTEKHIQKMTKGCDSCKHSKSERTDDETCLYDSDYFPCDNCVGDYSRWESKT